MLFFVHTFIQSRDNHTGFVYENQYSTDRLAIFWKPVSYTRSSIKCFLKHTYNNGLYAQKFLALNFSYHVAPLLSFAQESESPRTYCRSIIDLFEQKSKSTPYINAFSLLAFLEQLPRLIIPYFVKTEEQELAKLSAIENSLYNFILKDFNSLKEDPKNAIATLAQTIKDSTSQVKREFADKDISIRDLQISCADFLQTTLSRLIWNPKDQEAIWGSIKAISLALEELAKHNIITTDALDKQFWTLICRFTDDFLPLAGAELNEECYEIINKDLAQEQLLLWNLEEREVYITPKGEHIKRAIVSAQVCSRAFRAGLITDVIPPIN